MKKILSLFAAVVLAGGGVLVLALPAVASASTVYNAVPATLAPNYPSQPFQAQQTFEFGDYVHLGGTDRVLTTVTATMSDWALASTPANQAFCTTPGNCDATGFFWPITVTIYSNHLTNGVPDTVLATQTVTQHIAWRPEGPVCPADSTGYVGSDSNCYHGFASNITFDLSSSHVTLPNDVIVGFKYNTQSWGASPTGVDGPYNSLNIAIPDNDPVTAGTDDSANKVFWNTITASDYADGGAAGVGIFREDAGFGINGTVAMQINAVANCQPTAFFRDGINMTAALINPPTVSGEVDATGCNIGVYYGPGHSGTVSSANIHGSNYYGVVARGINVTVQNNAIHDIGETPLNGTQHGVGIYVANIAGLTNGDCANNGPVNATIDNNTLTNYQKGGIVVTCANTSATITNNTVTGQGPVNYIAQNGIQVSINASAMLKNNTVTGHFYTPATVTSCGLLFFQAGGVKASSNNVFNNQTNQCNVGKGGGKFNLAQ
jgi:hypothetical protein